MVHIKRIPKKPKPQFAITLTQLILEKLLEQEKMEEMGNYAMLNA